MQGGYELHLNQEANQLHVPTHGSPVECSVLSLCGAECAFQLKGPITGVRKAQRKLKGPAFDEPFDVPVCWKFPFVVITRLLALLQSRIHLRLCWLSRDSSALPDLLHYIRAQRFYYPRVFYMGLQCPGHLHYLI